MSVSLAIRDSSVIEALSDAELFTCIEKSLDGLRVYLEEAVRRGWTQTRIGKALGVGQPQVSKRMRELGVTPKQWQPPKPRKDIPTGISFEEESSVLVGEIVEDDLPSVRTSQTGKEPRTGKAKPHHLEEEIESLTSLLKSLTSWRKVVDDESLTDVRYATKAKYIKALEQARSEIDALLEQAQRTTGYLGRPT